MVDPALKNQIRNLIAKKKFSVLAIDGPCASGKSTLAEQLSKEFDCVLIHTDDFFLRPEQKTPERLAEIGGNFDRERFLEEVLIPLSQNREFSFRRYDCAKRELGETVFVPKKKIVVVEGSYSHHPDFADRYDLRIFLEISPEMQKERLLRRNPQNYQRFAEEWIPKENAYFDAFCIRERADLILNMK